MSLLDDLNPVQQKAVLEAEGPLLVFAGAGSGKTRVLTYRIAYLIEEKGVKPWNILAVTFTNKAADEMRERVEKLVGRSAKGIWISTFHSACARILRHHIELLGFQRNFVIYDDQDQERHLKALMRDLGLDSKLFPLRAVQSALDRLKNDGIAPEQFHPPQFNLFEKRLALIYHRYQEDLRRNNALDFGDLLLFVMVLFRRFPEVLRTYQDLCHYVMVDEFQDTNLIQYQMVRQIVAEHRNICVVGDDDQSIYRWRGAEIGNILDFGKDFPEAKTITLEQNYRSTKNILQAANHVVNKNRERKEKVLWTENAEGEMLTVCIAENEAEEARFVVRKIMELSQGAYRDIAVFYRINAQSRPIEDELVKNRIPYTVVGGMKFYERKEVKDILAYLKFISNPLDGLSFRRVINVPPRGIGEKTIEKIDAFSREKGLSLYQGLRETIEQRSIPPAVREKMENFSQLVEGIRGEVETLSLSQLTLELLSRTGYIARLKEEGTEEAFTRIENIDELVNVIMEFERGMDEVSLETFLEKVSLVTDVDTYDDRRNRVSLMTLHCAKGLEFPFVFIVGVEEGLLPHSRRGEEIEDMEEERRLFYVGITRAKERLFLSRAEKRHTFGTGRANLASRFLGELPEDLLEFEERRKRPESLFSWTQREEAEDSSLEEGARTICPEGFYPLRIGMKVRHPKYGEGRVSSVEGMDEDQKATILFKAAGSRRLKTRYAQLEILG